MFECCDVCLFASVTPAPLPHNSKRKVRCVYARVAGKRKQNALHTNRRTLTYVVAKYLKVTWSTIRKLSTCFNFRK